MSAAVFISDGLVDLVRGDTVVLAGDEGRHAVTVRRLALGEQVHLVDGLGARVVGRVVEAVRPDRLVVSVDATEREPESVPRLTVVQAIPKGDRGELAVEVMTEIGVDEIVPWQASRCVARWRVGSSDARWQRTAQEAAKQARRARFPVIAGVATTEDVSALLAAAGAGLVLHEGAAHPILDEHLIGRDGEPLRDLVVVVGPEGGLSDDERAAFAAAGAVDVRLGPTVLRTSTAGVAAAAALLSRTRRWRRV
jgi:16S rRNA (uracil1498-N3)-methyltransferase